MKENSTGVKATWGKVILWTIVIAALIMILPFIVIWGVWSYSPDKVDYSGEFKNSAGEIVRAEIKTTGDLHGKSFITLTDEKGRSAEYRVRFTEPEDALPKDMKTIDIDEDSYMIWVCEKDGGEIIFYNKQGRSECSFFLDSKENFVSEYEIDAVNAIEQSKALDGLPNAATSRTKWNSYFSKLKEEYQNSSKTLSKEDSV